jgi:hypothetical protein
MTVHESEACMPKHMLLVGIVIAMVGALMSAMMVVNSSQMASLNNSLNSQIAALNTLLLNEDIRIATLEQLVASEIKHISESLTELHRDQQAMHEGQKELKSGQAGYFKDSPKP